jgi:ATP synthase protein I
MVPKKQKNRLEKYKKFYLLGTIGVHMVVSVLIGLFIGRLLDKWLETTPWLMLLFLGFGVASGFLNLYKVGERELNEMNDNGK